MSELILSDEPEFFAPCSSDLVSVLIGGYNTTKNRILTLSSFISDDYKGVLNHFVEGNMDRSRGYVDVNTLFNPERAIKSLDSEYWSKALNLTDVYNHMPQSRRTQWSTQLKAWKEPSYKAGKNPEEDLPAFEEEIVRSTLQSLLAMRSQFLGEKIDGIFKGLSGEHVTNRPEGFSKRMILAGVINDWHTSTLKVGMINDLRTLIAKFMGRDEPSYNATDRLINGLKWGYGEWFDVDGGALRMRLYKKGTAHIEVHEDMAWRLNAILAYLYPKAIPPSFRTKPHKTSKKITLIQKPLPFAVVEVLLSAKGATEVINKGYRDVHHSAIKNSICIDGYQLSREVLKQIQDVLESIGGVKVGTHYEFDYDPAPIVRQIGITGCVPDQKSHQFYPTPTELAQIAVNFSEIKESDDCLEPSAGIGNIVDLMPKSTMCVEVSELRCNVLKQKGYTVFNDDFIKFDGYQFDKIVMNPPFNEGQWHDHVKKSASLMRSSGRLVAILPPSAVNKLELKEFNLKWYGPYKNMFADTSISVVILVADK